MVLVKKSAGNSGGVPSLDILAAKLRIVEAELSLEEREVKLDNGRTFMAEPNLNVKVEVVANMVDPGVDEGVRFYDRFKLKKDDGEWSFAKYSKLGNLIIVRYGEEWFEDPRAEFEEADFEDFEFIAQIEPKTDSKGKPLTGSTINWKSIRPAGGAEEKVVKEKVAGSQEPTQKSSTTDTNNVSAGGSTPEQGTCRAGKTVPDEGAAAEVAAATERAMNENDLKAALVRVTRDGEEVATVALGESMTGVPATEAMHFRNGAVAISYLGTVLLQLVDEGVVDLDDTIDEWLPGLPASDQITLRMLADSTSGYVDYVPMDSFLDALAKDPFRAWTTGELIDMSTDEPLLYKPGTNWSYSHANFVILGEALAAITGKPVEELIRERIVEPLGMQGTESYQTAEIPEPVLHAYTSERGTYEESTFWNPSWTIAKGAVMVTDICDLATSARAIGTGELVSPESHKEQIGPSLVGLGGPTDKCPKTMCYKQLPTNHYGIGTVVLGGWVLQNPTFFGYGGVQAYLPEKDLTIAAEATLEEDGDVGLN